MKGAPPIAIDLEEREIRLGSERVRLLPVTADASLPFSERAASLSSRKPADVFYVNDVRGPIVRALRFEERSLLLADVSAEEIVSRIADAALVSPGQCPDVIREAASLALAGGAEDAPKFSDCAAFAAQQEGWDLQAVGETMALLIDRLCGDMAQEDSNNGWKQIVFQEREPDVEELVFQMVTRLAERSGSRRVGLESETLARPEECRNKNERSPSHRSISVRNDGDPLEPTSGLRSVSPAASSVRNNEGPLERTTKPRSVSPVASSVRNVASSVRNNEDPFERATKPRSVSSVLPVDTVEHSNAPSIATRISSDPSLRIPARVLALNTDRLVRTEPVVLAASPGANTRSENPIIASSELERAEATTIPTTLLRTSDAAFSLTQAAPVPSGEPPLTLPSVGLPSTWQPFERSRQHAQTPRAASQTPPGADSPSFSDWLAELGVLLEAECDMRGIEP